MMQCVSILFLHIQENGLKKSWKIIIDVNTQVLSDEEAEDECLTFARKYLERKLGVNC